MIIGVGSNADGEDGFSLIELLVVVIIIGILAAIAIPSFLSQREAGYRAALQSDLRNVAVLAEGFFQSNGTYANLGTSTTFTTAPRSSGVEMTVRSAGATNYCIEASATALALIWRVRTDPALGSASIAEGAC